MVLSISAITCSPSNKGEPFVVLDRPPWTARMDLYFVPSFNSPFQRLKIYLNTSKFTSNKSKFTCCLSSDPLVTKFNNLCDFSNASTEIMASVLKTRLKGVSGVVDWGLVWWDHKNPQDLIGPSSFCLLKPFYNPRSNTLMADSAWSLVLGCSKDVRTCLIPNST